MIKNLVSIITPLYNSEKYISQTINSVISQTYNNWELLIIDDFSEDNGVEIVKKYINKDKRIKLVQLKNNQGAAKARNTGIKEAEGEYIAFLDSDDLWTPRKLERQINFMKANGYSFSFTDYIKKNEGLEQYIKAPRTLKYQEAFPNNPIGCLTVVYNVEKLGKIYMPLIRKRQDYALWLKILKRGVIGYGLSESLAYYRVRDNSISSNKIELIKYQWKLYREIENINIFRSSFYLLNVIIQKILGVK